MYDTQAKIKQEYLIRFKSLYGAIPLALEPIIVWAEYNFMPPRSWSQLKRKEALLGNIHYLNSDVDNITKFVFDLFNGTIWKDDRQIIAVYAVKKYAAHDSIKLRVWEWVPTPLSDEQLELDLGGENP